MAEASKGNYMGKKQRAQAFFPSIQEKDGITFLFVIIEKQLINDQDLTLIFSNIARGQF
jgi:hypothetical protein